MELNNQKKNLSKSKFVKLNHNLKIILFSYLPIEKSFNSLYSCNKSFIFALKKTKSFNLFTNDELASTLKKSDLISDIFKRILNEWDCYFDNLDETHNFLVRFLMKYYFNRETFYYYKSDNEKERELIRNKFLAKTKSIKELLLLHFDIGKKEHLKSLEEINKIFYENKNIESLEFRISRERTYIEIESSHKEKTYRILQEIISLSPLLRKLVLMDNSRLFENSNDMKLFSEILNEHNALKSIRILDFYRNKIKNEGMFYLASIQLPQLTELDLSFNRIRNEGVSYLAKMQIPNLTKLNLMENKITDKGMEYLASMQLPQLTTLILYGNSIGPKGMQFLASMQLPQIRKLDFQKNRLSDKGIKHLASMQLLQMEELILHGNGISDKGMKYFASMQLPQIRKLDLGYNYIGKDGIKCFSSMQLYSLEKLTLEYNNLRNVDIRYLASMQLPRLTSLDLSFNYIEDRGVKMLLKAELPQLTDVKIWGNRVSYEGIKQINSLGEPKQFEN